MQSGKIMTDDTRPFWERKTLLEMSSAEWESLCDGCGRCCLNKLDDIDTGEIYYTNVACTLFDNRTCKCSDYENRFATVPDCVKLEPKDIGTYPWLPPTCAYRLLDEGKSLPAWHPLISGTYETVERAGVSVSGRSVSEDGMELADYENHIVEWPGKDPTA